MKDARIWAAQKQARLSAGEFDAYDYEKMGIESPVEEEGLTLSGFWPRFQELRERGRKRPLSERYIVSQDGIYERYFKDRYGDVPLIDFTTIYIDRIIEDLMALEVDGVRAVDGKPSRKLKPHTINNIIGVIGRILTVAHRRGLIPSRPLIEKLPLAHRDEVEDILDRDEIERLLPHCNGVYGRLFKVYLLTGMRAMEGAAIRWEDYEPRWGIDENGQVIGRLHIRHQLQPYLDRGKPKAQRDRQRLVPPKWGSVRWVPVGPELATIFQEQAALTRFKDGFIFLSERGNPFCHELIAKALRRICRKAGLRSITPQVLRRTYISQSLMAGVNPKTVQQCAGHRSLEMTMKIYARLEDKFVLGAGGKLENHILKSDESARPVLRSVTKD
ncbi:MAG: site-specific integrase [Deltaproteobacteria bacterium]|nr:site-specific integrase [Deltaproteobacteria bacterium]